ncbi:hypothetical protein ASD16_11670 [Cellulomonas sp. Root485]|uniref:hypothetical protein n=1 Tax=Cellulomonas sp. Root485 TaxID=1736546 RepID=UPI0007004495|nr:hypothetical protein [Cellulomonas sp. Root485]KQY23211.1 hypothetical protein ASD16_11670 [Cellulomonas sp. Root485]
MKRTSRTIATAVVAAALALSPLAVSAAGAVVVVPSPSDTSTATATPTETPTATPTVTPSPPPPPTGSCAVSMGSTTVGTSLTVSCSGLVPGAVHSITVTSADSATPDSAIAVAGEKTTSKTAGADGALVGVVTLSAAGTYTIVVRDQTNTALSTHTVTAVARVTPTQLSETGVDPLPIVLGAAALIALGAGALVLVRRRQAS